MHTDGHRQALSATNPISQRLDTTGRALLLNVSSLANSPRGSEKWQEDSRPALLRILGSWWRSQPWWACAARSWPYGVDPVPHHRVMNFLKTILVDPKSRAGSLGYVSNPSPNAHKQAWPLHFRWTVMLAKGIRHVHLLNTSLLYINTVICATPLFQHRLRSAGRPAL